MPNEIPQTPSVSSSSSLTIRSIRIILPFLLLLLSSNMSFTNAIITNNKVLLQRWTTNVYSAFVPSSITRAIPHRYSPSSSFSQISLAVAESSSSRKSSSSTQPSSSSSSRPTTNNHNNHNNNNRSSITNTPPHLNNFKANLLTIPQHELEDLLQSWSQPKYRAQQILQWIHTQGATSTSQMTNLPQTLRDLLATHTTIGSLRLETQLTSKDGTIKRVYRLHDDQLIESVLMPYDDGRYTACVSSQAGCAMGCVFCATGQMGFARQLSSGEIYEQVARFAVELKGKKERLSNVVMMGMGEPLANYRNVMGALGRVNRELGIGARKITVSTVGVVPSIRKLMQEELQVRLAVSLHCAEDEERTALLPANQRYGGLDELMMTVKDYIEVTGRRVTFEWALIEGQNDTPEVARSIGRLLERFGIRRDMVHVNLIPLNPTGGFKGGRPSQRGRVDGFVAVLEKEFGIGATPRVRRGIDIEAGCGQLKAAVEKKEKIERVKRLEMEQVDEGTVEHSFRSFLDPMHVDDAPPSPPPPVVETAVTVESDGSPPPVMPVVEDKQESSTPYGFTIADDAVDLDSIDLDEEDDDDEVYDQNEIDRLINLVKGTTITLGGTPPSSSPASQTAKTTKATTTAANTTPLVEPNKSKPFISETILSGPTTTITDEASLRKAKGRKKKLLKNLRAIDKLRSMEANGKILNTEQREKVEKEEMWKEELESIEHNLQ